MFFPAAFKSQKYGNKKKKKHLSTSPKSLGASPQPAPESAKVFFANESLSSLLSLRLPPSLPSRACTCVHACVRTRASPLPLQPPTRLPPPPCEGVGFTRWNIDKSGHVIDFSHAADAGDNERVFLAPPAAATGFLQGVRMEVLDKLKITTLECLSCCFFVQETVKKLNRWFVLSPFGSCLQSCVCVCVCSTWRLVWRE